MEGRSLLRGGILLLALSILRIGMDRVWVPESGLPGGGTELHDLLEESRNVRDEEARRTAPLSPNERLDPNRSGEEELDRLPGIGPATARALVADREEKGGFRRPEDLLRVAGIGPATLAKIRPYLDFSTGLPMELSRTTHAGTELGPQVDGLAGVRRPGSTGPGPTAVPRIDLNRGSLEELQSLPGIGPALAERILESRIRDGWFRRPDDLLRVRGIGAATLARIRPLVIPGG